MGIRSFQRRIGNRGHFGEAMLLVGLAIIVMGAAVWATVYADVPVLGTCDGSEPACVMSGALFGVLGLGLVFFGGGLVVERMIARPRSQQPG